MELSLGQPTPSRSAKFGLIVNLHNVIEWLRKVVRRQHTALDA